MQVVFFPYIPVKDDIELGDFVLWPFYERDDKHIGDPQIKEYLKRYFGRYFYCYNDELLRSVTILSPKGEVDIFRELTSEEKSRVWRIAHILAFTSISYPCIFPVNSDAFLVYVQCFTPGEDGVAIHGTYYSKLNLVRFVEPPYIKRGILPINSLDPKLLEGLGQASLAKEDKGTTRIMRSLEWYYYAHSGAESISEFSKIVMMSTAFEMLFNLPKNKRCSFRKQICDLVDPMLDEWAKEFYDLRSTIVHGGLMKIEGLWYKNNKNNKSHLQIANRVFRVVVKKKLCAKGFYKWDAVDGISEVIMKEDLEGAKTNGVS